VEYGIASTGPEGGGGGDDRPEEKGKPSTFLLCEYHPQGGRVEKSDSLGRRREGLMNLTAGGYFPLWGAENQLCGEHQHGLGGGVANRLYP